MGQRITKLTPFRGFAAESAGALTLIGTTHLQTVHESVPPRTIMALLAARDEEMAEFRAELDMGEGGPRIPRFGMRPTMGGFLGPQLRVSGAAIFTQHGL